MKLSSIKLDKLSDVSVAIGQVFFASVFIEPIVSKQSSAMMIITGVIISIACFVFSISLHDYFRKINK